MLNRLEVKEAMIHLSGPSPEFRAALKPYPEAVLRRLNLPPALEEALREAGLPRGLPCCVFEENPIAFYPEPLPRRYALIPGEYLEIARMDWVGVIALDRRDGRVWQIFEKEFRRSFMNRSLPQYTACLGIWMAFYPRFQEYLAARLRENPGFSLFENPEVYEPVRRRLAEADPEAMAEEGHYWPRCCEPDIV
ncbi:SUKH-4 family immunity protein [Oscillospiraceae bacterium 38-13]